MTSGEADKPGCLAWAAATAITLAGIVVVLGVAWMAIGVFFVAGEGEPDLPRINPLVSEVLEETTATDNVHRISTQLKSPLVLRLDIEIADASELTVVFPGSPGGGRFAHEFGAADILVFDEDGFIDVGLLEPMSALPAGCGASCGISLFVVDPRDVHLLTDGQLVITETVVPSVHTQTVLDLPLPTTIMQHHDVELEICVSGVDVSDDDGLGRFVTLQQRLSNQVGPNQVAPQQAHARSLHHTARARCQAEFQVDALSWGSPFDSEAEYDEITMNVVHWGDRELDGRSDVMATVEIVE